MDMDRIEKRVVLRAKLARVWEAISDSAQFGTWFGAAFEGPFVAGEWVAGRIAPTRVDPEVAKMQEKARGMAFSVLVDAIEPMTRFAFRWHPFAVDPGHDYSQEPTTLVEFVLRDAEDGVALTISESGFDRLPEARRVAARAANDGGWGHQARLIGLYLAQEG